MQIITNPTVQLTLGRVADVVGASPELAAIRRFSMKDICALYGRSRAQVYRDIKNGDIPAPSSYLGRSPRWTLADFTRPI